jgi:hypothetical protein
LNRISGGGMHGYSADIATSHLNLADMKTGS